MAEIAAFSLPHFHSSECSYHPLFYFLWNEVCNVHCRVKLLPEAKGMTYGE
jgi:hypothetical protein